MVLCVFSGDYSKVPPGAPTSKEEWMRLSVGCRKGIWALVRELAAAREEEVRLRRLLAARSAAEAGGDDGSCLGLRVDPPPASST